jgi:hypothetical protein
MDAVSAVLPRWLRPLIVTRFVLVTLGSAIVLVLLAVGQETESENTWIGMGCPSHI